MLQGIKRKTKNGRGTITGTLLHSERGQTRLHGVFTDITGVQGIVRFEDTRVSLLTALGLGRCESTMVFCAVYGCNKCSNTSKKGVLDKKVSLLRCLLSARSGAENIAKFPDGDTKRLKRSHTGYVNENATDNLVCAKHFISAEYSLIWHLSRSINTYQPLERRKGILQCLRAIDGSRTFSRKLCEWFS